MDTETLKTRTQKYRFVESLHGRKTRVRTNDITCLRAFRAHRDGASGCEIEMRFGLGPRQVESALALGCALAHEAIGVDVHAPVIGSEECMRLFHRLTSYLEGL